MAALANLEESFVMTFSKMGIYCCVETLFEQEGKRYVDFQNCYSTQMMGKINPLCVKDLVEKMHCEKDFT